jgi:hypothetical protein
MPLRVTTQISSIPLVPVREDASERVVTVFLTHYNEGKRNFRCIACGWVVAQIEAGIGLIIDGDQVPKGNSSVDVKCRRCSLTVRFLV